jgi:hypothetical protein
MDEDLRSFERQLRDREEGHVREMTVIREEFEAKLAEQRRLCAAVREANANILRELEETVRQLEDDSDKEIESLREAEARASIRVCLEEVLCRLVIPALGMVQPLVLSDLLQCMQICRLKKMHMRLKKHPMRLQTE